METTVNTQNVRAQDLAGSLVETKTDSGQYQVTDCQISNTSSAQHEFLSGTNSVLTV
jgi:hypothetical protein